MEFKLLHILLAFMALALAASEAAFSPEMSKLPNTPMPQAIRDTLHPDLLEDKSTSVDVGKGGVDVDAGKGQPGGGTQVGVGKGGVGVSTGKPDKRTNVGVGKGGDIVTAPGKESKYGFYHKQPTQCSFATESREPPTLWCY